MTNKTIEDKSDKILQGISDKARKASIKKALGQYQRLQMEKAGVKIPIKRPKETEVSFTKRITYKIKDFSENTKFNPVRKNLEQYKRKTSTVNKYKGGMIKKKPVVKAKKKK